MVKLKNKFGRTYHMSEEDAQKQIDTGNMIKSGETRRKEEETKETKKKPAKETTKTVTKAATKKKVQ